MYVKESWEVGNNLNMVAGAERYEKNIDQITTEYYSQLGNNPNIGSLEDYYKKRTGGNLNEDMADAEKNVDNGLKNAALYKTDYMIDQDKFSLPDMGDFYIGAVDTVYLKKLDKLLKMEAIAAGNDKDAAFYTEKPPFDELGLDKKSGMVFVKANVSISQDDIDNGRVNGNTLRVDLKNTTGDKGGEAINKLKAEIMKNASDSPYFKGYTGTSFDFKLAGINVPQTPKWAIESADKSSKLETKKVTIEEARQKGYIFPEGIHDDSYDEKYTFIKVGNNWHEVEDYGEGQIRWCMNGGDEDALGSWSSEQNETQEDAGGVKPAKMLKDLIDKANGEVYFAIDPHSSPTNYPQDNITSENPNSVEDMLNTYSNDPNSGYNLAAENILSRFTGAAYVNIDGKWINISKYLLTDHKNQTISPDTSSYRNSTLKMARYDQDAITYADAYFKLISKLDDRKVIQHDIFGEDFTKLRKWTVTLGDVTLFVPPANITVVQQIENERMPLMRASGSMAKTGRRVIRKLQMTVYFNEDRGINGFKYKQKAPSGKEFEYDMNGLRAIISQFKFVPFLPVDNEYINDTLGIQAVTVESLNIRSVEGYPRLMIATIDMTEFNYATYIPQAITDNIDYDELSDDDPENDAEVLTDANGKDKSFRPPYRNFFAETINWKTLRWYYQRPLLRGDEVVAKELTYNTNAYNQFLLKNHTVLVPMRFNDSSINFYIADSDDLNEILKAKMYGQGKKGLNLDEEDKDAMKKLSSIYQFIKLASQDGDFTNAIDSINQYIKNNDVKNINLPDAGRVSDILSRYDTDTSITGWFSTFSNGKFTKFAALQKENGNTIDQEPCVEQLNNAFSIIGAYADKANEANGEQLLTDPKYKITKLNDKIHWGISYKVSTLDNISVYESVRKTLANCAGASADDTFTEKRIYISLILNDDNTISVDWEHTDLKCLQIADGIVSGKLFADQNKAYLSKNLTALENIKYNKFNMPITRVKNWSVSFTNHITRQYTIDMSGSSPQYMGGEDAVISFDIETTSSDTVSRMNYLPQLCGYYARHFHKVMPASVVKVESEFLQFCGINEVLVQNVIIDTVPNYPKLWSIHVDLIANDRTLRQREALNRIEADNAGESYTNERAQKDTKSYFEIQNIISQAELYPDLELPTIEEMQDLGWDFVRYKFQDHRKYVDPDFYFVYLNVLYSQFLRELIIESANKNNPDTKLPTDLYDKSGSSASIERATRMGFESFNENDVLKKQLQDLQQQRDAASELQAKKQPENLAKDTTTNNLVNAILADGFETWEVSDDIRSLFLESNYKREYDTFLGEGSLTDDEVNNLSEKNKQQIQDAKNASQKQQEEIAELRNKQEERAAKIRAEHPPKTEEEQELQESKIAQLNAAESADMNPKKVTTEGRWVYNQLGNARVASKKIEEYLDNKRIDIEIPDKKLENVYYDLPADQETSNKNGNDDTTYASSYLLVDGKTTDGKNTNMEVEVTATEKNQQATSNTPKTETKTIEKTIPADRIQEEIYEGVQEFFNDGDIQSIMQYLNIDVDGKFMAISRDIIYSAACAATGQKEFSNKRKAREWRPDPLFVGVVDNNMGQDFVDNEQANTLEQVIANGTQFGYFRIKQYDKDTFESITEEPALSVWGESKDVNANNWLIDPYYRYKPIDDDEDSIKQYKKGCINSPKYCTFAYLRIMLYWLKKLIDIQALPAMTSDILNGAAKNAIEIARKNASVGVVNDYDKRLLKHIEFFNKRSYAIDTGKIWAACVLASGDGNPQVLKNIENRDYKALNGYISGCSNPSTIFSTKDEGSFATRKMILALIGLKRITDANAIGVKADREATSFMNDLANKKYIEAAEDPTIYCAHSCHDMIVNDARGRMLRAFPTYYMVLIDEGREIGNWRLHDNFYNNMAISKIEVIKSKKMPADIANVTMTNFYGTFTMESEDYMRYEEETWDNTFRAIFGPMPLIGSAVAAVTGVDGIDPLTYGKQQEKKRKGLPPQDHVSLRAGARVHIRMGYGSNAAMLPVVFNGAISDIDTTDMVVFTAQGDGAELTNPILDTDEAHDITTKDDLLGKVASGTSATTYDIMCSLLTYCGGWLKKKLKDNKWGGLLGRTPLGVYHFGNPDYTDIEPAGEPTQNIFRSINTPAWGTANSIASTFKTAKGEPEITFDIYMKTLWDAANICRSVVPDFICAVAPFGFRSTLFIGHPRYYYAYDYIEEHGVPMEKRKPYQQFHLYNSVTDIMGDGITASQSKIHTAAIGLFSQEESATFTNQKKIGPIFADIDIYSENQKTMLVDSQLIAKGVPYVGFLSNSITNRFNFLAGDKDPEKIAWRMTASALKESMKEMYCGDLVVIGDPSVKPHDRICINDAYQGISGQATIKECTLSISADDGFITTISPDLIVTVDDQFEAAVHSWMTFINSVSYAVVGMASMAAIQLYGTKKFVNKITPEAFKKAFDFVSESDMYKSAKDALNKAKGTVIDKAKGTKVGKMATRASKSAKVAKVVDAASKAKGLITGVRAAASITPFGLAANLISIVGFEVLGKYINNFLTRELKEMQALQVWPLKRFGYPWTAGLAGQTGLIIGAPHAQPSILKGGLTNLLSTTGKKPFWADILVGAFVDENVRALADKYRVQQGFLDENGNPVDTDSAGFSAQMKKALVNNGEVQNDYRAMQLVPRVADGTEDYLAARDYFAIKDVNTYQDDPKMEYLQVISDDPRIIPYMGDTGQNFFRIAHEEPALNPDPGQVEAITLKKDGTNYHLKLIHGTTPNGEPYLDAPLLNKDTMNILYEIIRRAKNKMPPMNCSDRYEHYEETKNSFVCLESALRIGDKESEGATGFTFILEGYDKAKKPLADAITELYNEIEKENKANPMRNQHLFYTSSEGLSDGKVAIRVMMPKMTSINNTENNGGNTDAGGSDNGSSGDTDTGDTGTGDGDTDTGDNGSTDTGTDDAGSSDTDTDSEDTNE